MLLKLISCKHVSNDISARVQHHEKKHHAPLSIASVLQVSCSMFGITIFVYELSCPQLEQYSPYSLENYIQIQHYGHVFDIVEIILQLLLCIFL